MKKLFSIILIILAALNYLTAFLITGTEYEKHSLKYILFCTVLLILGMWLWDSSKKKTHKP
ncbi:MAG: hypothetical protein DI539_00815 [Flavobacterium psychrophilum]|nr:MAG: hypothetical protein DI539_00815 [Flavobacterium psychrophilum]